MGKTGVSVRKIIKIGRPGFRATKVRDHLTGRVGVLFQIDYPEISAGTINGAVCFVLLIITF